MNKPKNITPEEVVSLESKCPNIARFFRSAVDYGSPESHVMVNAIKEQSIIESYLAEAMSGYVPLGVFNMFLAELSSKEFKDGLMSLFVMSNRQQAIRDYVEGWFKAKGVVIEIKKETK